MCTRFPTVLHIFFIVEMHGLNRPFLYFAHCIHICLALCLPFLLKKWARKKNLIFITCRRLWMLIRKFLFDLSKISSILSPFLSYFSPFLSNFSQFDSIFSWFSAFLAPYLYILYFNFHQNLYSTVLIYPNLTYFSPILVHFNPIYLWYLALCLPQS